MIRIENSEGGVWVLTAFGAYGPTYSGSGQAVYAFTKAQARRVVKHKGGRLDYTILRVGTLSATFSESILRTRAIIKPGNIQFGCQTWEGSNATILRKWALSK
jgi:hypothetical protein